MANLKRQPVVRPREALRYPIVIIHLSPARRSPRSLAGQGGWMGWGGCGVVHTVCWSGRQDTLSSITVASRGVGDHSGSRKRQTPGLPRPLPPRGGQPEMLRRQRSLQRTCSLSFHLPRCGRASKRASKASCCSGCSTLSTAGICDLEPKWFLAPGGPATASVSRVSLPPSGPRCASLLLARQPWRLSTRLVSLEKQCLTRNPVASIQALRGPC